MVDPGSWIGVESGTTAVYNAKLGENAVVNARGRCFNELSGEILVEKSAVWH